MRCIYALNATIQTAIEVEIGWFGDAGSIGEDLLVDDSATSDHTKRTPEETEERNRNMDLISRQAEKRKEKIDRAQAGAGTRQVNDFQAPALAEPSNLIVERVLSAMSVIFSGPPVSAEARRFHRPLTDTEKCAFAWRRLIDSALQENTDTFPWPLCNVAFVWKCSDDEKWSCAVNLLMVIYNGANIKRSEQALVKGQIGEMEYADQSQNARIYAVEKIVKDLRDSYDPVWEPDMLAADQRAIFAVCSTENSYSEQHASWANSFIASCEEKGDDFSAGGDYQKRLEVCRSMLPLYKEGLAVSYHSGGEFYSAKIPSDFKRDDPTSVTCHANCSRLSIPEESLKLCSRCKIVSYCSRECQVKD